MDNQPSNSDEKQSAQINLLQYDDNDAHSSDFDANLNSQNGYPCLRKWKKVIQSENNRHKELEDNKAVHSKNSNPLKITIKHEIGEWQIPEKKLSKKEALKLKPENYEGGQLPKEGIEHGHFKTDNVEEDEEPFIAEKEDLNDDFACPEVKLEIESDSEENSSNDGDNSDKGNTMDSDKKDYFESIAISLLKADVKEEDKDEPSAHLDWKQFCHVAGPGEKVPLGRQVKRMNASKMKLSNIAKVEKPSLCNCCGMSCSSPKTLSEHFKSAHSEQCIVCPDCGLVLMNLRRIRVHFRKQHNLTKEAQEKYKIIEKYRKENGLQSPISN